MNLPVPSKFVRGVVGAIVGTCVGLSPAQALANATSQRLTAEASGQLYNLDLERAAATFREAVAADAGDAAAYRGLAGALWAQTAFARGTMTVDSFLGRVTSDRVKTVPPPPALVAAFREAVEKATALSRAHVERHPDDVDALFEFGASMGLRASYAATIDGSIVAALRSARSAFDAHERVLALDPARGDAGLVVGTYRYLVSALSRPMRWLAYVAGFGGDAARGLRLVEGAARYSGDSQTDARLALVLLYNRERQYDNALSQLIALRERYPANRLLWLESGSTLIRASRAEEAERLLNEGLAAFARDTRPKMFGEEALWFYKRGLARATQGRDGEAAADFQRALGARGRGWVHGRTHLELGKLALKAGHRDAARQALQRAVVLCEGDQDPNTAEQARRLMNR